MVDLDVTDAREDSETGERLLELSVSAEFPANAVEVRVELLAHGADRLREALEPDD